MDRPIRTLPFAGSFPGALSLRMKEGAAAIIDVLFLLTVFVLVVRSEGRETLSALGPSILLAGLAYGVTAFLYRRPLPVQPLKVLALSCLVFHPAPEAVDIGAYMMGAALILLGASGGVKKVREILTPERKERFRNLVDLYIRLIVVVAAGMILAPLLAPFFPRLALEWGVVTGRLHFHFQGLPVWLESLMLILPQLPVTIVNGLILSVEESRRQPGASIEFTGGVPFGERALACSLGAFNILAGLASAFPICHGSAAFRYYRRLSVRTLFAPLLAGGFLVILGSFFCLMPLSDPIPGPVFGLAVLAGLSMAQSALGGGEKRREGYLKVLAGLSPGIIGALGTPVLGGAALFVVFSFFAGFLLSPKIGWVKANGPSGSGILSLIIDAPSCLSGLPDGYRAKAARKMGGDWEGFVAGKFAGQGMVSTGWIGCAQERCAEVLALRLPLLLALLVFVAMIPRTLYEGPLSGFAHAPPVSANRFSSFRPEGSPPFQKFRPIPPTSSIVGASASSNSLFHDVAVLEARSGIFRDMATFRIRPRAFLPDPFFVFSFRSRAP